MNRIRLEIGSGLSEAFDRRGTQPLVLEQETPDGATVSELLGKLAAGHKTLAETIFDPRTNELNGSVIIVVNRRLLRSLHGPDAILKDGDSVMLLPFVDGG